MSTIDLLLRYAIISLAFQLACAWVYTFQSPWPLADAFQLAPSAERQLFQSLGVRLDPATTSRCRALLFLHREGLAHFAQPIESKSAVTAICVAVRTIAHAAYTLSAPGRLTP